MLIAQKVKAAAAEAFGVTVEDIEGPCRRAEFVRPRFAVCAALRWNTDWGTARIGHCVGGRDHTTVLNAVRKADGLYHFDAEFRAAMDEMEAKVWGDSRAVMFKSRRAA